MEAHGSTGQIYFDGEWITLARKGFRARSVVGKGEKRLHVRDITGVQWKPAGGLVNGFIQFTVPGGNERRSSFGKQTTDAAKDENSVVFTKKQMPAFAAMRTAVEQAVSASRGHGAQPYGPPSNYGMPPQAPLAASGDVAGQLRRLCDLHTQGLITNEEFGPNETRSSVGYSFS